jgi:hypothetical protein
MSADARRVVAPATMAGLLVALASAVAWPASSPAASAHPAPRVQVMVVGRHGAVLSPARTVAAAARTVRVGTHTCAVASATPLAVLLALHRAGGPAFALRDYGHCGSSPRNSAELFVKAVGGEQNSGRSGWEYKVEGVAGSTGAGDPSGPLGDGRRLRAGARVLWFYCETTAHGCQRTLTIKPRATSVAGGSSLQVTVDGYDDEGTLAPVVGASVLIGVRGVTTSAGATLAGNSAAGGQATLAGTTGAGGHATLTAPATPGTYELSATAPGLVPSFPVEVTVG